MAMANIPDMRLMYPLLCRQLEECEGNESSAYQDSLGYWSIGVGTLIDKKMGGGLFPEEIEYIFMNRVNRAAAGCIRNFPWVEKLDDVRRGVMYGMMFQLGLTRLLGFRKFLTAMAAMDFAAAAREMEDSKWYRQTPRRVKMLQKQIITGEWQLEKP